MMYVIWSMEFSMIMALLLMFVCTTISKTSKKDREKVSPFECGFDPKSSARSPFSIQFFLIAVLFLIFDIEIAIILPIILTMKWTMNKTWIFTVTTFLFTLTLGLYHEWNNGVLEWAK